MELCGQVRRCWNCKYWKPKSAFYKGKQYRCIECYRAYYIENRERILTAKRVWYIKNKESRAIYARKYRARKEVELELRWRALP
ncbi:hypothetical protein LCGC14_0373450 [marine sediment metagenome]|uniref:Uncharacterized protein n=1 Tax=marine sediment metagenome TaxID=412755 RepID=A0A0F9T4J0_9ZZZZ